MCRNSHRFAILVAAAVLGGAPAWGQTYQIPGPGGLVLTGTLSKPAGSGPFPAVILFHGLKVYSTYAQTFAAATDHYNRMGIATIAVDWGAAHGMMATASAGGSNGYRMSVPGSETVVDDAFATNAFLRTLPFIRGDKIFFEGFSYGAGVAARVVRDDAAGRPRFAGAIGYSPYCSTYLSGHGFVAPLLLIVPDQTPEGSPTACLALRGQPNVTVLQVHSSHHDYWEDRDGEPWLASLRDADTLIAAALAR
ncbi:MAG: alpha/beta hydrolase [Alphaproteobacteria bacterium]|nr:alpha/beta hydrolase [Alphaproteobacteria bacterium]